jgi:hypothetical protein
LARDALLASYIDSELQQALDLLQADDGSGGFAGPGAHRR